MGKSGKLGKKVKRKPSASATSDLARSVEPLWPASARGKPSSFLDTRVFYCGDNLEQLAKLPDQAST